MISLSHNYRGLANPSKRLAIWKLVLLHNPILFVLHETMMDGDLVVKLISSSFPGWNFIGMDASGKSSGLIISWRIDSLQLTHSWAMPTVLGTIFFPFPQPFLHIHQ